MNNDLPTYNSERTEGLDWLRDVLTSALEVCPLSYQQKKKTTQFLGKMPDWLTAKWSEALNIGFVGGCSMYPDMVDKAKSDTGRNLAQQYLEAHDAVPAGHCLDQLCRSVVKHAQGGRLPVDINMIERQVCALAWVECTEDGIGFSEKAWEILGDPENHNHILVDYQMALERGDKDKLEKLDTVLTGGRYGEWVAERLTEGKRYLGLEPPSVNIRYGERTPQWELLWKKVFTGGDD